MVSLSEFAKARGVNTDTVNMYIRRHPELFEGHIIKQGRYIQFDEEAEKLLDKIYPLPVQVVVDEQMQADLTNALQRLEKAREAISNQQAEIYQLKVENAEIKANTQLLTDRNADKDLELDRIRSELAEARRRCEEQKEELAEREKELAVTKAEIEGMKNYGLLGFLLWKRKA